MAFSISQCVDLFVRGIAENGIKLFFHFVTRCVSRIRFRQPSLYNQYWSRPNITHRQRLSHDERQRWSFCSQSSFFFCFFSCFSFAFFFFVHFYLLPVVVCFHQFLFSYFEFNTALRQAGRRAGRQ